MRCHQKVRVIFTQFADSVILKIDGRLVSSNRLPHFHYISRGTGKTSTILAVARALYGEKKGTNI